MSAQASKAAREAVTIILYPFRGLVSEQQLEDAAAVFDEALADLIKVCDAIASAPHLKVWPTVQTLAETIEPWKAGE